MTLHYWRSRMSASTNRFRRSTCRFRGSEYSRWRGAFRRSRRQQIEFALNLKLRLMQRPAQRSSQSIARSGYDRIAGIARGRPDVRADEALERRDAVDVARECRPLHLFARTTWAGMRGSAVHGTSFGSDGGRQS
jgi:hypothetical protein